MGKEKKADSHANDEQPKEQETASCQKQVTIPETEYAQLKDSAAKANENWDRLLRLQADFENARKRWEKDRCELVKYASEDLISNLLNVVDDIERSIELSRDKHEDMTALLKGLEMILSHLYDLLRKNGVTAMDAKNKPFDPHYHEALMQSDNEHLPENTVLEEIQKGYLLNNRVLRTAKVQVSRKKHEGASGRGSESPPAAQ